MLLRFDMRVVALILPLALAACSGNRVSEFAASNSGQQKQAAVPPVADSQASVASTSQAGRLGNQTSSDHAPSAPERSDVSEPLAKFVGSRTIAGLDEDDRRRAYETQLDALDKSAPGAPVTWKNPDSGSHGTIVTGPTFDAGGQTCRAFTHTIYVNNSPQIARGTVCRKPGGGQWLKTS